MRRTISVLMCVLLTALLVVPAAAWAGNARNQAGEVSGSGNGQQTALTTGQTQTQDRLHQDEPEGDESQSGKQTKDVPPGLAKAKEKSVGRGEPAAAAAQARSRARVRVSQDTSASVDTSPALARDRDRDRDRDRLHQFEGIENALSRIRLNVAKAEQRMADGKASQTPPGLLRVMEKFMAWLGLAPDGDAAHDGDEGSDDNGGSQDASSSVEPSLTPDPDDGTD